MKKWLAGVAASIVAGLVVSIIIIVIQSDNNGENDNGTKEITPSQYTISIDVMPEGCGIVTLSPPQPGGVYEEGAVITLFAEASEEGYDFYEWGDDASGNKNPTSITMNSDKIVTAIFKGKAKIVGTINYGLKRDGVESVAYYRNEEALIWLVDSDSGMSLYPDYDYDLNTGEFIIEGLTPGKYQLRGFVDSGYPFNIESPGDFSSRLSGYSDEVVIYPNSTTVRGDIEVVQLIHLMEPWDNQDIVEMVDFPMKLYHYQSNYGPSAKTFEWEPVPGAIFYSIRINLCDGNNNLITSYPLVSSESSSFSPNLDITTGSNYYVLSITAYGLNMKLLGVTQMVYKNAYGGPFKFTVAPRS